MDEENNVEKKLKDSNSLKGKYIKKIEWKKDEETEFKKEKLNFPKRKYAIIHGYFGHNFKGNQKYFYLIEEI
jgi:hypothetical protein